VPETDDRQSEGQEEEIEKNYVIVADFENPDSRSRTEILLHKDLGLSDFLPRSQDKRVQYNDDPDHSKSLRHNRLS